MKNFHVPLPEETYTQLRAEADRTQIAATSLARAAINLWLREQRRKATAKAIAEYAREMAGSTFDLDPALESAAVDHLLNTTKNSK
jgi:hypothetical protein